MGKKKKIAEKIAPLAVKITEYILDHQDDATQEDRWRTTMRRDMAKGFREQREANDRLDSRFDMLLVKNLKNLNAEQKPQEPQEPPARQLSIDEILISNAARYRRYDCDC